MDPIAIGGAISSFKTLTDIAQSFLQVRDTALIQGKVVELQTAIIGAQNETMALQAAQAPLVARLRELEQEIVRLKDWEAERLRYQLKDVGGGRFVYSLRPGVDGEEPPHSICERCYEDGRKSILQRHHNIASRLDSLQCSRCHAEIRLSN